MKNMIDNLEAWVSHSQWKTLLFIQDQLSAMSLVYALIADKSSREFTVAWVTTFWEALAILSSNSS